MTKEEYSKITPEQKKELNRKKSKWYNSISEERKEVIRLKQREKHYNYSEEYKKVINQKKAEYSKNRFDSMSPIEKEIIRKNSRLSAKKLRDKDRKAYNKRQREYSRKRTLDLSEEEKNIIRIKRNLRYANRSIKSIKKAAIVSKIKRDNQKHPIVVYFILCDGYIKIGCTITLTRRKQYLRTRAQHHPLYGFSFVPKDIPITILHFIDGGKEKEREIHRLFPWIRYGEYEWFKDTKELRDYIKQIQLPK